MELVIQEKTILESIKKKRIERGYSQQYMAQCLGIEQSTYHKIENGNSALKMSHFLHVCAVLDELPTYFLKKTCKAEVERERFDKIVDDIEQAVVQLKGISI